MLVHCLPSSEWVPDVNIWEMKATMKETSHPISHTDDPFSLACTPNLRKYTVSCMLSTLPTSIQKCSPFKCNYFLRKETTISMRGLG